MLRNYFMIAWRNLKTKKSFSFINIVGLSIGMAAATLIILWIQNELSYDKFHEKIDRTYQVWNKYKIDGKTGAWNNTPKVMAATIKQDYPEIESTARVNWSFPILFSYGDKRMKANGTMVDSTFLQIFSFPVLRGNAKTALHETYSIALTEKLAKKIFGDEDPMGKVLKLDNSDNFTVTAILKDLPNNTAFDFEYLLPWAYLRQRGNDDIYWGNNSTTTYVLLKKKEGFAALQSKIKDLRKKYDKGDPNIETFLYPVSRLHLYGQFEDGIESGGKIEGVRLFGIIAGLILLIACINFMNLSTARSEKRAKEVGIRKVAGAQKANLISQFLGESVLLSFIAAVIGLIIVTLALPSFNDLVNKQLAIDYSDYKFWLAALGFVLFTGLLAGSYPAIYLSSFRPIKVLKGTFRAANAQITPRKILVVIQFTFAIVLIISTIIVRQQLQKGLDRKSGYSKDNLIFHHMEGDIEKNYMLIKNELLNSGIAVSVSKTSAPITEGWSNTWGIEWPGKPEGDKTIVNRFVADDAIVRTAGMELVAGRDFDLNKFPTDSTAVILNESAVKLMGFEQPIGQIIKDNGTDWHIVGVVKDFILISPFRPIEPMVIEGAKSWFNVIHIKFSKDKSTAQNLKLTEKIFKKYNPEYPFNYSFVDEQYFNKFNDEKRTGKLASLFACLAIIISCLGLFGLASYMAENRIKEIGVRKVLGASVTNITRLLSVDFLKLVIIAFVIAGPLAYWLGESWLKDFPYRVNIQWWVFAMAGILSIMIALLTVGYQAVKAAMANPVKSLRSE